MAMYMLVFTVIAGIIISLLFLISSKPNRKVNIYLAFYFLILSLYGLIRYLILFSGNPFLIALGAINFSFVFLLPGPLFYFYVRAVLFGQTRLSLKDTIHFIPALIHLLVLIPWLITPFSVKFEFASVIVNHPDQIFYNPKGDFLLLPSLNYALRLLSVISYISYSFYITSRYEQKFVYPMPKSKERVRGIQLLYLFMTLQFLMYILYLISVIIGTSITIAGVSGRNVPILSIIIGVNLLSQVFIVILFPFLLYGLPVRLLHGQNKV